MAMPPTIMAIATNRKASIPLPGCHSRKPGRKRLSMRAKINTKTGRLPMMVETRDTGPLCIAQSSSITPTMANASLKVISHSVEFLCFIWLNCRRIWGRSEAIRKMAERQKAPIQDRFQNEM